MSVEKNNELNYGTQSRWKVWRRLIILLGIVIVIGVFFPYGLRTYHAFVLYQNLMSSWSYRLPLGVVTYEEDPIEGAQLLKSNPNYHQMELNGQVSNPPVYFLPNVFDIDNWPPSFALLYMHPFGPGDAQLVVILAEYQSVGLDRHTITLRSRVIEKMRLKDVLYGTKGHTQSQICGTLDCSSSDDFRFFAGQPKLDDPYGFIICYSNGSMPGEIEGNIHDNGVSLKVFGPASNIYRPHEVKE